VVAPPKPAIPVTPVKRPSFLDLSVDDRDVQRINLRDDTATAMPKIAPAVSLEELPVFTQDKPKENPLPPLSVSAIPKEEPMQTVMESEVPIQYVGELFSTYVLAQRGESLFIIDKHAAHERILYNKLKANAHSEEQMLLVPVAVTVSREEHTALLDSVEELKTAGISIEDFGGQSVLVRSFPLDLTGEDIDNTLREIATGLVGGNREVQTAKLDWIYHSSACRAAIKAGDLSKPAELLELAKRVLSDDSVRFCPHGRPVCIEMTKKELEKQFGRIL
jgi:DNA mismatch repair protein MutL